MSKETETVGFIGWYALWYGSPFSRKAGTFVIVPFGGGQGSFASDAQSRYAIRM